MEVRRIEGEENLFEVESASHAGESYVVDLIEKSCTCPHFRFRGVQCKHIKAVTTENHQSHEELNMRENEMATAKAIIKAVLDRAVLKCG